MKIKEIKIKKSKKQIDEIKLSSFVGDYGDALAKQTFGKAGNLTKKDIMAQNIFTRNFVSNALSNLDNAVKGGLVDIQKHAPIPKAQAGDFAVRSAPPKTAQAGDIGDFDLKQKVEKEKAQQAQAQATRNQQLAAPAQARVQRAAAASPDPATAAADARVLRAQQQKQAQTPAPKSVADKLDQAAAKRNPTVPNSPTLPRVRESKYDKLNALFESIVNETVDVPTRDENTYSVKDYLKNVWFPNFMKGVNWQASEAKIDQLLQKVQDTYAKDRGQAALSQLANLSFAISPRKSQDQPKKSKQKDTSTQTQQQEPVQSQAQAQTQEPVQTQAQAQTQEPVEPITAVWGREKYTKGPTGWFDSKGKIADSNTAKYLDQAAAQSKSTPVKPKPTSPAGAAAPAKNVPAQNEPSDNVVDFRKKTA